MRCRLVLVFCCCVLFVPAALAQPRVLPQNLHERLLCIVPMTGAGTADDPRRPLFAPKPKEFPTSGLVRWSYEASDDGKFALVEFVARDRSVFAPMLADRRPDIKVWERGKVTAAELEREFRRYKRDFDANRFARGR